MLGAVLDVDQEGPYIDGEVNGHQVSFLIDTGARRSTVCSAEVPNLTLSGKQIQVVGISNRQCLNEVTEKVPVKIRSIKDKHQFIINDTSPVNLLRKDLLCKFNCVIYFTLQGIAIETQDEDFNYKIKSQEIVQMYQLIRKEDLLRI